MCETDRSEQIRGVGRGSEVVRIWNGVTAVPVEKAGYVWKRLRKNEGQWVEEK